MPENFNVGQVSVPQMQQNGAGRNWYEDYLPTSRLSYRSGVPFSRGKLRMPGHCPGAANLQTPPLTIRKSPQCGKEVGVFSTDGAVKCSRCRFVVYHDMESCIPSGSQAKECPGDGMYWNMTREKKRYFH